MATSNAGTNANNSLTSLLFGGALAAADIASIANSITDDINNKHPIWAGAFAQSGLLYIPNRGVLQMRVGDYVGVDASGWPVLISARAFTAGSWHHT
jgi:hypothetical protein